MNARQKAKKQKKEIDLMRNIITDCPAMQELYDAYNKPKFVTHTTMQFHQYKARRIIPVYMDSRVIEPAKQAVAMDLLEVIKENITYEIDVKDMSATITASIFIGKKE